MAIASTAPDVVTAQREVVRRDGRSLAEINGEAGEVFLPAPMVAARYNRSDMTLHRWLRDPRMQFPQPHYFGRFRYWKLSRLVSWERERAAARPLSNAHSQ